MTDIKLYSKAKEKYGDQYDSHFFEQYKIYIESAEKISDRRQNANNYFITINTALITLLGLSFQIDFFGKLFLGRTLLAVVGVIICVIFWFLLRSYKQLNSVKFKVIHAIEKKLPLALYDYEWEVLGKGENKKLYYPFSHIELFIPWVFGILYFVMGIIFLVG